MKKEFLACERKEVFLLLMFGAGMMGAYTFILRGGVFCNAQTANFVMMAVALGLILFDPGLCLFYGLGDLGTLAQSGQKDPSVSLGYVFGRF